MCWALPVVKVSQEIRVLQVLQDTSAHPSLAPQDPKAPKDPKALQVFLDVRVNLDQSVKVQSLGLREMLAVLDQTESQGVLVTWGIRVRTHHYLVTKGTMGT